MTPAQWIYYFAAEMVKAMPRLPLAKAMALGRAAGQDGEPEVAARAAAQRLNAAGPARRPPAAS